MKNILISILVIPLVCSLVSVSLVYAEDEAKNSPENQKSQETQEENGEKEQEQKEEKSLEEQRRLTIQYGIDSQIIELINQLKEEKNDNFNSDLKELFNNTSNTNLKSAIIDIFSTQENDALVEDSFELLQDYDSLGSKIVLQLIRYLEEHQTQEITDFFFELIEDPRNEVASAAITAIGVSEKKKYSEDLLTLYENNSLRDELKAPLISALGNLKNDVAFGFLDETVSDDDESKSLRWRACQALGKIGGEKAYESVSSLLNEEDPILRSYAVNSLGYFDQEGVVDILIDALRDSMWRVRVQAAEALGRKQDNKALDILKYKAEYDPDIRNVRLAAVKAIGKIDGEEGYSFLRKLYSSSDTPLGLRTASIKILVEENLTPSLDAINKVMKEEWEKDESYILDYTCKMLSTKKSNELKPLYKKMLNHPSHINLLIYGLRGVQLNKISSLKAEVEKLTGDSVSRGVRSLAKSVLTEL